MGISTNIDTGQPLWWLVAQYLFGRLNTSTELRITSCLRLWIQSLYGAVDWNENTHHCGFSPVTQRALYFNNLNPIFGSPVVSSLLSFAISCKFRM